MPCLRIWETRFSVSIFFTFIAQILHLDPKPRSAVCDFLFLFFFFQAWTDEFSCTWSDLTLHAPSQQEVWSVFYSQVPERAKPWRNASICSDSKTYMFIFFPFAFKRKYQTSWKWSRTMHVNESLKKNPSMVIKSCHAVNWTWVGCENEFCFRGVTPLVLQQGFWEGLKKNPVSDTLHVWASLINNSRRSFNEILLFRKCAWRHASLHFIFFFLSSF